MTIENLIYFLLGLLCGSAAGWGLGCWNGYLFHKYRSRIKLKTEIIELRQKQQTYRIIYKMVEGMTNQVKKANG